ncbi:MAG: hypothetical protein JSS22_02700 [Proteobacteria bacterium]|nr:hypothetical protein [Pseudomonadota bacterium]
MRTGLALAILIGTTVTALADSGAVIVVPGRPGVPIIINGVDASYAVVEGDWGFARSTHVQPTVYGGRYVDPEPHVGHYYPSLGHTPGYGRLEIEPPANRKLPPRAESFHQSWSAHSDSTAAQPNIPQAPPAVIVAPDMGASGSSQDFQRKNSRQFRRPKP